MKIGKITAKLRDAVPVCLTADGKETVQEHEKITFEINYSQGALPEVFPEPRVKITRAEKAATKKHRESRRRAET